MQQDQFQLHCDIEQRHWWFVARRRIISELVGRLVPPESSPPRQATIIDVGCGTGANAAALAADYHCVGIDTSADAIRMAAQRFPAVDFRAGFAPDDLGDCIENARLIMLNDVLEHVEDDFRLLSSLLAATQPGTYFVITVPADMALWSEHDESFGHYRRYDRGRLQRVWENLPVEPLLCSYFNARLYPLVRLVRTWNRFRGRSSGRAGTDFNMPGRLTNRLLTGCFAGERHRLANSLNSNARGYRFGVSLVAVLKRLEGSIDTRTKPVEISDDVFDPVAAAALLPVVRDQQIA